MAFNFDWVNGSTINEVSDTFHSFEPNQSQINKYNDLSSKRATLNLEYSNAQRSNQRGIIANAERKLNDNARSIASLLNGTRGKQNSRLTATRNEESTSRYVGGDKRALPLVANNPRRKRQAVGALTQQINFLEQQNQGLRQGLIIPTADGNLPEFDDTPEEAEARKLFYDLLDNDMKTWQNVQKIRSKQYQGLDPTYQTGDLSNPFTDYDKRRRLQKLGIIEHADGSLINEFPWLRNDRPPRTDAEIRAKLPPDATTDDIEHFQTMNDSDLYVEYGWPPRRDEKKRRPLAEAAFQRALAKQKIVRQELMRSPWVPSTRQPMYVPSQAQMNQDYPNETYMPSVSLEMFRAAQRVDHRIRTEDEKLTKMREMLNNLDE